MQNVKEKAWQTPAHVNHALFSISWFARSAEKESKERKLLETTLPHPANHHLFPLAGNLHLGEMAICEVDGVRGPSIPTGISASPSSLEVKEDGEAAELVVSLHSPLPCNNCSLNIRLTSRNNCKLLTHFPSTFSNLISVMCYYKTSCISCGFSTSRHSAIVVLHPPPPLHLLHLLHLPKQPLQQSQREHHCCDGLHV